MKEATPEPLFKAVAKEVKEDTPSPLPKNKSEDEFGDYGDEYDEEDEEDEDEVD